MTDDRVTFRSFLREGVARWIVLAVIVIVVVLLAVSLWPRRAATSSTTSTPSASASPGETTAPPPSTTPTAVPTSPTDHSSATPITIASPATVESGVKVVITKLKAVSGTAQDAGDIAGPSVQITMTVSNSTSAAIPLNTAVVNLYYGSAASPASPLPGPGVKVFPETLGANSSATAVYVFRVPTNERSDVTITFDYSAAVPITVFTGAAPS